jgi:hypothetical protein
MYAWVGRIALGLAPVRRGFYLHLRAGFERLGPFPLKSKFSSVGRRLLSLHELSAATPNTGARATIAAVYPER